MNLNNLINNNQINPQWPSLEQKLFKNFFLSSLRKKDHLYIASSGTDSYRPGHLKLVALSKEALLSAATGVVQKLELRETDVYVNPLPLFHIGGVSVWARHEICPFKIIEPTMPRWNPQDFIRDMINHSATITSLVPTQIFDLVNHKIKAPLRLRWALLGAGTVSLELWRQAIELGWPLLQTYGMTETSAMLAYRHSPEESYQKFPHIIDWKVVGRSQDDPHLAFLSKCLLSEYVYLAEGVEPRIFDPKENGWFVSDDLGEIHKNSLILWGRSSELVKILGETVSLVDLEHRWKQFLKKEVSDTIIALPEKRRGYDLCLVTEQNRDSNLIDQFNHTVAPYMRIKYFHQCRQLPKASTGKILKKSLVESILNNTKAINRGCTLIYE